MASELTLIDRTLGGDRDTFADLISGYLGLVHGIILNKVRRPDEVEDLVQDVFVKAYQELPKLRERDKFGAWLGRIALNRAQAWLRQRQSHRMTVTDDPKLLEKVDNETPDDVLAKSEKDTILWDALDQLRPEYRQILLLFHFEDCPQRDIASFLNISVPTVKWWLMRARTALKRRVEDVVRGGTCEARRQQQKERIAATLPVLALVVARETPWRLPPALFTVLRQGTVPWRCIDSWRGRQSGIRGTGAICRSRGAIRSAPWSCIGVAWRRFRRRFNGVSTAIVPRR